MDVESAYTTEFLDGHGSGPRGGTFMEGTKVVMDKKRLEYYKKKLVTRREELMKTIARTQEEGRQADEDPTVDLADKAANSYTKEFLFGMTNTDRTILNMIDAALKRIQKDDYGVCANCQEEMQQKRLEAVPWAKHCIACQEKMEQGLL
jgi:DnaK suppressor protein